MNEKYIILTFDVEEWYHTSFMTEYITPELLQIKRLEKNLEYPLQLLKKYDISATFFVLGDIAKNNPKIVRLIKAADTDHEIASHSFFHDLLFEQNEERIRLNVRDSKHILEDQSGSAVRGFRAPYFSINDMAVDMLLEHGYKYDSSLHDFRLNPQYGHITLPMKATHSPGIFNYKNLFELTIPVKRYFKYLKFPFGGGGYFRLYPLALQLHWIKSFLKTSDYFLMYMHPWEFDTEQPYVGKAPFLKRTRHYLGVANQYAKTEKLIKCLIDQDYKFLTVSAYLDKVHA